MKVAWALSLLIVSASALGQTLIGNPISGGGEPPGFVYYDDQERTSLDFEIRFRLDSQKVAQSVTTYGCGWTPNGFWLYDRHPNTGYGRWMVTLSRDGRLCFRDMPGGLQGSTVEFADVASDVDHVLTARNVSGQLLVSLDGEVEIRNATASPTYRAGPNGIGIGREVNGYHNRYGNDSFPGEVCYVYDNGRTPLADGTGVVTGSASMSADVCGTPVPPPPPPPPAPCDDPDSVECACHLNPHPACNSCSIP